MAAIIDFRGRSRKPTVPEIRHTFFDRPSTLLATVVKEALSSRRVEDTLVLARTVLAAPASPPPFAPTSYADIVPAGHRSAPRSIRSASPAVARNTGHCERYGHRHPRRAPAPRQRQWPADDPQILTTRLPRLSLPHRQGHRRGGFGITYAAEDTAIRRRVALKELFHGGACYRTHANEVHVTRPDRDDGLWRWARFYFSEPWASSTAT
jgi:hypothetical protein